MSKKMVKTVALALTAAMSVTAIEGFTGKVEKVSAKDSTVNLPRITEKINRVSVHDPSIFEDPNNPGTFYAFGSHIATAKTYDLANWTQVSTDYQSAHNNKIYGNIDENLKESFKWAGKDDADCKAGYAVWAPDVIYNPNYRWNDGSKGAYMLYYCTSSTWRRSCIGYMVSKKADGDYKYVDTIMYSGFTNTGKVEHDGNSTKDTTWTTNNMNLKKLVDNGVIEDMKTDKCFNADGTWNHRYAPNAIDPNIFFDKNMKKMYMSYGSWSGGIYVLELDPNTGKPIYPGKDSVDPISKNVVDRYFGTHIAGGNHQSGEGPYIKYDKGTDYYYFYETYGGLTASGGYNMRLFRSKNPMGPYVDAAGRNANQSGVNCGKYGIKLIGNYQFYNQPGYKAAGHNSALITEEGNHYLVSHQRFADASRGESHEIRVRQQFMNQDKWPVTAVYENRNEKIGHYDRKDVVGTYEFINHGTAATSGTMLETKSITLNDDGTISGDLVGTWKKDDTSKCDYVTININKVNFKGVFYRQENDNGKEVMTFTAIGNNNESIWGSKFDLTDKDLVNRAISIVEKKLPKATRENIELPQSISGVNVKWKSDKTKVISNEGVVKSAKKDTNVTLTATFIKGNIKMTKKFIVTVNKRPSMITGYDFEKKIKRNEIAAMKSSKSKEKAHLVGESKVIKDVQKGNVLQIKSNAKDKKVNYLALPSDTLKNVKNSGYTVSMWVNVSKDTFEHSALFEADRVTATEKYGQYPMTRIGANLIGRINAANNYSDAIAPDNLKRGQWQHVIYTVSSNGIKVYLNGKLMVKDEKDISSCFDMTNQDSIQNTNNIMVGAGAIWNDEDCRDTRFDDIKIFDVAITSKEATYLYEGKDITKDLK
ncbi:lipocalin-like domain-containing protein [Lachnobacterium bovis]|uniref:lipocalin-like domain-containing protein n=1 Tax=Lachnobacterium bovis TaxID=140626 RepID=UPI0003B7B5E5|nr:glycoside hydrolase family 43 C-terminal domain-containing protein [Lachnobacterium bovis]